MAPRKRARVSAASTPLGESQPRTPIEAGAPAFGFEESSNDPWTDDQETSLFKSMIRWKPTGMHKHFRMLAISQNLRSQGYTTAEDQHTRIPGIWAKLSSLYDLEALDEREHDHTHADAPDPTDPSEASQMPSFELPEDEYGELIWDRRLSSSAQSSPPVLLHLRNVDDLPPHLRSSATSDVPDEGAEDSAQTPKPIAKTRGAGRGRAQPSTGRKDQIGKRTGRAASNGNEQSDEQEEEDASESNADEEETTPVKSVPAGRVSKRGGRGGRRGGRGARRGARKK